MQGCQLNYTQNHKQSGFSLVEMMVSVGIIVILLAIAGGAYSSWRENTRVDSAREEIVSILQQARLAALSRRTAQAVTFNYAGAAANPNSVGFDRNNSGVVDPTELYAYTNVTLQDYTCGTCTVAATNTQTINFTPRGTGTGLSMRISSPGTAKVFYVMANTVTGRVDVRRSCVAGGGCQ